jgi:hypothetical protein
MRSSPSLEERAERARQVYEWVVRWQPPDLGDIEGGTVKRAVLSGAGEYFFQHMLGSGLYEGPERERLRGAIRYCRSLFDHTELQDAGSGVEERLFANIYDLLLASRVVLDDRTGEQRIYRGHRDSAWQLLPSYYRSSPVRSDMLSATVRRGRLVYLQKRFPEVDLASLGELEQEAVIQHYLSGTRLLDFTRSPEIAAFFATHLSQEASAADLPAFGAIYRISPADLHGLTLGRVEAPELPEAFLRIHRQRGVFILIDYQGLINEPGLFDRWIFYHTRAGLNFECEALGITQSHLLP